VSTRPDVVEALSAFFGAREVQFSLDSGATGTTRTYHHLNDAVRDVELARVLSGFHFRNSDIRMAFAAPAGSLTSSTIFAERGVSMTTPWLQRCGADPSVPAQDASPARIIATTAATMVLGSIGFGMCRSKPAFSARSRSMFPA
jgi:hypothetical protein